MVFGNYIGHKYSTYIGGKTINLGSFKNNEYPINNHKIKNTITYTSFFNSNWPKKEYFNTKVKLNDELITLKELFVLPDKMVLDFLVKYGKENNKKIFIIPRSKSNSDSLRKKEENYYKNILDLDINFMDYNHNYSSYNALDSSSVNVTIDSTLGYESLTRGNKVAFFSIRGSLNNCQDYGKFGWPGKYNDTGYFWTNIPNEKNFKTILDRLFLTSEKNWKKQLIINNVDSLIIRKENFIISQFINNELV